MTLKIILALVLIAALVGAALFVGKTRSHPAVAVTLRITVTPKEQSDFVAGQANSMKFKYLMGKQSGVKPLLAQKLSVKPVPNSSLLEAQVGVLTKEDGARYTAAFVETLQYVCGSQAQVALADQSIR